MGFESPSPVPPSQGPLTSERRVAIKGMFTDESSLDGLGGGGWGGGGSSGRLLGELAGVVDTSISGESCLGY